MAKETVKVDNGLEELELVKSEKLDSKKDKTKKKEKKKNNEKKETTSSKNKEGFFKKVANEMRLVTWPSKKNVFKYSLASILMVVFLAVFFMGISAVFDLLYGLVQGWIG